MPGQAQRGDRLLLARPAGIEGTALLAIERSSELAEAYGDDFVARAKRLLHDPGISVVSIARLLLNTGAVTALHDPTEGGVANGVREIAAASGLGAVMDRNLVPLLEETATIAQHFGIDPVHFGVVMVVNLALGMITPPFGVNLFAACTVARILLDQIVTRLLPFVLVFMILLVNRKKLMGEWTNSRAYNAVGWLAVAILIGMTLALLGITARDLLARP